MGDAVMRANVQQLVKNDLDGRTTKEENAYLESHLDEWAAVLQSVLRECEASLINEKAALSGRIPPDQFKAHTAKRAWLVKFKMMVVDRYREIKARAAKAQVVELEAKARQRHAEQVPVRKEYKMADELRDELRKMNVILQRISDDTHRIRLQAEFNSTLSPVRLANELPPPLDPG